MMKRRAVALLVVTALSAAGIAYAAKATPTGPSAAAMQYGASAGLPKGDAVFGGGHFTFISGRSFSVTAAGNTGTLQYGVGTTRAEITCLNVVGNAAVVGGIIRESVNTADIGDLVFMYFVDNGPPVGPAVGGDMVSPLNIVAPGGSAAGGLPKVCPAVDATQATLLLDAGDVFVHAK
jgi:hypothetical protein